jgi:hypothetical protein
MGIVALSFGLAAFAVVAVSAAAWKAEMHRYGDAFAASGMLFMTWSISNILTALYKPPDCWKAYPVMDLICGVIVMWMWSTKPAPWKLLLAGLFVFDCIVHVAFWLQPSKTWNVQYLYTLVLNVVFGAQLLVAAWPGGARLGAGLIHRLPDRAGHHRPMAGP